MRSMCQDIFMKSIYCKYLKIKTLIFNLIRLGSRVLFGGVQILP